MSRNPGLPVKRTEKSEGDHIIINPYILAMDARRCRSDAYCRCRQCQPSLVERIAA